MIINDRGEREEAVYFRLPNSRSKRALSLSLPPRVRRVYRSVHGSKVLPRVPTLIRFIDFARLIEIFNALPVGREKGKSSI